MKKLYFYLAAVMSVSMLYGCKEPAVNGTEAGKEPAEILEPTKINVSESEVINTAFTTEESKEPTGTAKATEPADTPKADILLTAAPEISLTDSLSSTISQFTIQSGSYSWNYKEGEEMTGVVACGIHPLDANMQKSSKLSVPVYNGIDYAPYTVSCIIPPDRLTVRGWDANNLGDTEAAPGSQTVYEDKSIIELKPNMVYEITAQWDQENLEVNGFYGEASYAFLTE